MKRIGQDIVTHDGNEMVAYGREMNLVESLGRLTGLWQPRLTIPLTPSMKLVPVIPPSTNFFSSVV